MRLVMPVSSDLASFSADNRTRTKYRGKRVPSAVFLAIPLPMGYHACIREYPFRSPPKSQPMTPFLNTTRIYVDAADDWIAERAGKGDIVVTSDIPLASRCVKAGADVIAPNGKPFTEQSIGMTLAVRNLMTDLRSSGEGTGGPRAFAPRDRSAFLSALDQTIRRIQRQQAAAPAPNQN